MKDKSLIEKRISDFERKIIDFETNLDKLKKELNSTRFIADSVDLPGEFNWNDAHSIIDILNALNFKGCNTWRLPTIDELKSLKNGTGIYWSSTEDGGRFAWIHNFNFGQSNFNSKTNMYRVRAVRDV